MGSDMPLHLAQFDGRVVALRALVGLLKRVLVSYVSDELSRCGECRVTASALVRSFTYNIHPVREL